MSYKGLLFAAAASLAVLPAMNPAFAEVASGAAAAQAPAKVTQVQYYGWGPGYGGWDRDYHGYGYGPYDRGGLLDIPGDIIAGTAGVVGGALGGGPDYYGPYAGGGGGVAACERHFRSFNPSTGTYTTYSGEQVVCPYLRG